MSNQLNIWTCSICGNNTSAVEYDYLTNGTDHLSCHLLKEAMQRRTSLFTISEELVLDNSNDAELGAKVRKLYYESKK